MDAVRAPVESVKRPHTPRAFGGFRRLFAERSEPGCDGDPPFGSVVSPSCRDSGDGEIYLKSAEVSGVERLRERHGSVWSPLLD